MYFKTAIENIKLSAQNQLSQWRFFLFTAAGQLHLPNEIDLGCTCPLFESNSSRDASGDTGHHMTDQNRNPNSI